MPEHVAGVRRLLALRRFPILDEIDLREVALVAENARERTFPRGATVARPDTPLDAVQLVIEGELASDSHQRWGANDVFGLLEVLAGREVASAVVATRDTHVLTLRTFQIEDLLEDSFGMQLRLLRQLATMLCKAPPKHRAIELPASTGMLGLVERLVVMRQLVPFANARLRPLSSIAYAARELAWRPGDRLVGEDEIAETAHVVLAGTLVGTRAGCAPQTFGAGESFGCFEMLGRQPHALAIEAATPVQTLAIDATTIVDVMEDHADLGIRILRACARAVLDRPVEN